MNKKGFTLIELLAVIILLGIIAIIAVPTAIQSVNESKEKLYKEQVKRILDAADSWSSNHDSLLPDANSSSKPIYITPVTLQRAGLLKKDTIKNPMESSVKMENNNIVIYYDNNFNQYVSVYCDKNPAYQELYYTESSELAVVQQKCALSGSDIIDRSDSI